MQKNIGQNHPRYEKRGQWAQFNDFFSKKSLRQSFSNRREWKLFRRAAPVFIHQIIGFPAAPENRQAPANAAGYLRTALAVEVNSSGFSKPIRRLTEHKKT